MIIYQKEFSFGKLTITNSRPSFDFTEVKQIHSNIVLNEQELKDTPREGDGIYYLYENVRPKLPLMIKTADCQPIIVQGTKGIAFIHAGWRGVHKEILISKEIINLDPTYYFFGPSIKSCCYEVGEEFKEHFKNYSFNSSPPYFFDMMKESKRQIQDFFGAEKEIIFEDSNICTFCHKEFRSFRRDKNQERNFNLLYLK